MKLFSSSPELIRLVSVILGALITPAYAMETPPTFQFIVTQMSFDFHNVSSWSGGGGTPQDITSDSGHPFAGRQFGGGTRATIRGTRTFGSGYPYGVTNNNTIAGRPFPYGVWPLYWGQNIAGSDEYGPDLDPLRPGGQIVIQSIVSQPGKWNVTSDEIYYHITDRETALAIMTSFVSWCHATPAWPTIYEPGSVNNTIGIENVFQYYRASSYALAFKGYNNSQALNITTESVGSEEGDPLPDVPQYSGFRKCLDAVIVNALPIVDGPPKKSNHLGLILGIIFGIFGIPILAFMWGCGAAIWSAIFG